MSLSRADIDHVAKLARLELTDAEKDAYAAQLSSVLDYVGQLSTANVDGIEPMAHVLEGHHDILRNDVVQATPADERDLILGNFPARRFNLAALRRAIDQDRIGVVDVNENLARSKAVERRERAIFAIDRHVAHPAAGLLSGFAADHLIVSE